MTTETDDLRSVFVEALPRASHAEAAALPDLGDRLVRATVEAGDLVEPEVFVLYLAERLPNGVSLADALTNLRPADLALAAACALRQDGAVQRLERVHGDQIRNAVSSVRDAHLQSDDLHQMVRQKLFVGTEELPALIGRFSGQGKLRAWLRVTAKRLALNAVRDHGSHRATSDDALLEIADDADDAELMLIKDRYRGPFREAFLAALTRLSERARTLIRLSVVDGLSVRVLGRMYGAHPATAARWLARARRDLLEATVDELGQRVELSPAELESVLRVVQSRFDLSVIRLFGAAES